MATEETELAFIRCPGCRSLVPSVATRCRMCGEPLQAKKESAPSASSESGEGTRKMRIRQRTSAVVADEAEGSRAEVVSPVRAAQPEDTPPVQQSYAPPQREERQQYTPPAYEYHEAPHVQEPQFSNNEWSNTVDSPLTSDMGDDRGRDNRPMREVGYQKRSWEVVRPDEPEAPQRVTEPPAEKAPQRQKGSQSSTGGNSRGSSFRLDVRRRSASQAEGVRSPAYEEHHQEERRAQESARGAVPPAPRRELSRDTGDVANRRLTESRGERVLPAEVARQSVGSERRENTQHQPPRREEMREMGTERGRRESWHDAMRGSGQPVRQPTPVAESYQPERALDSSRISAPPPQPKPEHLYQKHFEEAAEDVRDYQEDESFSEEYEAIADYDEAAAVEEFQERAEAPLQGEAKRKRKRKRKKKRPVEATSVVTSPLATTAGAGTTAEAVALGLAGQPEHIHRTEPVYTPPPPVVAEPVYTPAPPRQPEAYYQAEPVMHPEPVFATESVYAAEPVIVAEPVVVVEPVYQPEVHFYQPPVESPRPIEARGGVETEIDTVQGLLLGWFVIYDQSGKGVAREIHSGRFFVGGAQLRDSDFVLVHPSVSTPHCLVHCIPGEGIKVLDLMSERGTYVKRRGTNAYVRHAEQVTLAHGDWLRFGSFEVLVCLIPT